MSFVEMWIVGMIAITISDFILGTILNKTFTFDKFVKSTIFNAILVAILVIIVRLVIIAIKG